MCMTLHVMCNLMPCLSYSSAMFYWMLLNIHPAHRSTLRSIQLLTVVRSSAVKKYGIDAVLTPAVKDLKTLGTTVSVVISV